MPAKSFDLRNDMHENADNAHKKRIIFMGTGPFAEPLLKTLFTQNSFAHVVGVITKPDAHIGRHRKGMKRDLHHNPIKEITLSHGVPLLQPSKITEATHNDIKLLKPDLFIVVSYGKILSEQFLALAPLGGINVHASLLPLLRGASPIQNALLSGFSETGITIMQMDQGLDTGDILTQAVLPIVPEDTHLALQKKLADLSATIILSTLSDLIQQTIKPTPQDHTKATLCQTIDRADGHITWMRSTEEIINRLRAFTPWPGIFSYWNRSGIKQTRIKFITLEDARLTAEILTDITPATVFTHNDDLFVRTANGAIKIATLQKEGGAPMDAKTFINGHSDFLGAQLS